MLLRPYNYFQVPVGTFNGSINLDLNAVQIFRLVNLEAERKKEDLFKKARVFQASQGDYMLIPYFSLRNKISFSKVKNFEEKGNYRRKDKRTREFVSSIFCFFPGP